MKNTIIFAGIVALVLVLVSNTATSQVQFNLGLKTGLNFGTLSFDPELYTGAKKSGKTGFAIGADAELGFAKMFFIVLQPRYIMKGSKYEDGGAKATQSINEVEIPLHFKVKFLQGPVRPYGFVGPNMGIVLSAKNKFEGTQNDGEVDIKDDVTSTDFAIDFGGGAEYWVASQVAITGDVRYSMGLSNLLKNPAGNATAKSRGFQLLFGVLFRLGS